MDHAGLLRASYHDLCRLYATILIEEGEDMDVVLSLMRHADPAHHILLQA